MFRPPPPGSRRRRPTHRGALVHLANASYRLSRALRFDPETERVIGDEETNRAEDRVRAVEAVDGNHCW